MHEARQINGAHRTHSEDQAIALIAIDPCAGHSRTLLHGLGDLVHNPNICDQDDPLLPRLGKVTEISVQASGCRCS